MFNPVKYSKVVTVTEPLPPCWITKGASFIQKDSEDSGIFCVGKDGDFLNEMISAVDNAEEVVLASSFLFTDEKLCKSFVTASERGP